MTSFKLCLRRAEPVLAPAVMGGDLDEAPGCDELGRDRCSRARANSVGAASSQLAWSWPRCAPRDAQAAGFLRGVTAMSSEAMKRS